MKNYLDCKYPAFISYAHKDDQATVGWITQFHRAFIEMLAGKLPRDMKAPNPAHMSGWNGPNHGQLMEQLKLNMAESHSLFIIVHDHYVTSEVCLQELKLFKQIFGEEGFRKRLFIIALTGNSIDTLVKKPEWQELVPKEQIWRGFFEVVNRNIPIQVITNDGDSIAPPFVKLLSPIVDALVEQINAEAQTVLNHKSDQECGIKTSPTPTLVIAPTPKDLDAVCENFVQNLENIPNLVINRITRADLNDKDCQTNIQHAHCVVQFFNSGPPLLEGITNGGHLGWIKGVPNLKKLYWVDCEASAPAMTKADNRHDAVFADIRGQALTIAETIEEIMKIFNISTPRPFQPNVALVYIETNTNHKKEWKYLKSRVQEVWQEITYPKKNTLAIVCHALPLEDYQKVRNMPFNNLDGIILLWGEKDQFAIQEQVGEIDKLITAQKSSPVPGIVAYLTPPAKLLREQPLATGWDVARFDNNPEKFHEHIDDTEILKDFLSDVMKRYTSKQ